MLRVCALLSLGLLAACATEPSAAPLTPVCAPFGGDLAGLSLTDEEATNVVDLVDHASLDELAALVGASRAVDLDMARPFADDDRPIDQLSRWLDAADALELLDATVDWCADPDGRAGCCVDLPCEALPTRLAGVELDEVESLALLEWANAADRGELIAVCGVGQVMADDILAARPVRTLSTLDRIDNVGADAVERMVGRRDCPAKPDVFEVWCSLEGACTCR